MDKRKAYIQKLEAQTKLYNLKTATSEAWENISEVL
ncbi:MAG: hypothetical protein UZ01_02351 [Candidatus Brocadia sinica]|nr:MAG: hypothetical protein UZ01_02351 [Candidatus Brocadia sinica]